MNDTQANLASIPALEQGANALSAGPTGPTLTVVPNTPKDVLATTTHARVDQILQERPKILPEEWKQIQNFLGLIENIEQAVKKQADVDYTRLYAEFCNCWYGLQNHKNPLIQKLLDHDISNDATPIMLILGEARKNQKILNAFNENMFIKIKNDFRALEWWTEESHIPTETFSAENFKKEFTEMFQKDFRSFAVHFVLEGNPRMKMNKPVLVTLLRNMIRNAQKHGKADSLRIRIKSLDSKTVIEIADNGSGISPDVVRKIFEYGFSGHGSSGMGLAFAPERMQSMGGRILCDPNGGLENKKGGAGAKFVLELERQV